MIKDGFYGIAKVTPSPNRGGQITPRVIIVHDTAGALNVAGSVAWLCNPQAKASAHFVIGRNGEVHQLISCNLKAWHAGVSRLHGVDNVNGFSIGIELVNPGQLSESGPTGARASFGAIFDRKTYAIEHRDTVVEDTALGRMATHKPGLWMPYPAAQLDALLRLCLELKQAYGITEVQPHWYISPGRKVDTNPLFPLRWFQAKMTGRQDTTEKFYDPNEPLEIDWERVGDKLGQTEPPKGEPIDDKAGRTLPEWAVLMPGTVAHVYPSLNDRGSYIPAKGMSFQIVKQNGVPITGMFPLVGNSCPEELIGIMIPWVKVRIHEGEFWVPVDRIATATDPVPTP